MDTVENLILQHQDYVRSLARGIARKLPRHVDFEELVSLGQVGLISAARQYEPGRGVAFATFAYYRIRGAIFDGLRQLTGLPPSVRRQVARMGGENEVAETTAETSEASDDPEFLAKQFETAVGRLGAVFLLSRGSGADGDDSELEPTDDRSTADIAEARENAALVMKALERLTTEQRELIRLLYFEQRSMTEVAQSLNKNKSTISRRHAEAIDALRSMLSPEQKQAPPNSGGPPPRPPRPYVGAPGMPAFPLPPVSLPPIPPRPG
ncbi:MAG TPA: sigma-70 family RNA polymerase sigma factor [Tepidisphaeraceae bacterium]